MVTKVLNTIVLILLILICVTSKILVDEIEKGIPEINYTIYEIKLPRVVHESKSPVLLRVINSVKEEEIEYKYKFYKKFEMIYYCTCDECRMKWTWSNPPRFKRLIPNSVAAANPKDLLIGTHITIDGQKILGYQIKIYHQ